MNGNIELRSARTEHPLECRSVRPVDTRFAQESTRAAGVGSMRKAVALSLVALVLLVIPTAPIFAGSHGGGGLGGHGVHGFHGRHGFRGHGVIVVGPFAPRIIFLSSPLGSPHFVSPRQGMRSRVRVPHGFVRQPSFGWGPGGGWVDPDEVVVTPQFADPDPVPSEAPVPDPKFVSAPTPSASSRPGSHTVIVQRGSKIEVQSFPTAR